MKFTLRPGAELDVLNQHELRGELASLLGELRRLAPAITRTRWLRPSASGTTDGSGDVTLEVYRVPQGMEFRLGRVVLEVDGYSAGVPFSGGGLHVLRDGLLVSPVPGPLPTSSPYAEGAQPRFRNGSLIEVQVFAGPVNTQVTVSIEGTLHVGAA